MINIFCKIDQEYKSFSKMHKKIANYVLDNSDKVILMSIRQLSEESGVSEATIVRFVYRLGFDGYKDFQKSILESIKYSITTIDRLSSSENIDYYDLVKNQVNSDLSDISDTFSLTDPDRVIDAAELIDNSKRIYVLGLRTSNLLAQYLTHYLMMMGFDIINIEATQMEPYEQLHSMTENDLLIVFSFPRYSQRTIESTRLIYNKGFKIITITDSDNAPISSMACINLIAKITMSSIFDSLVSPLVIVNILIKAVSVITKKEIKSHLEDLEAYWEMSNTYEKI